MKDMLEDNINEIWGSDIDQTKKHKLDVIVSQLKTLNSDKILEKIPMENLLNASHEQMELLSKYGSLAHDIVLSIGKNEESIDKSINNKNLLKMKDDVFEYTNLNMNIRESTKLCFERYLSFDLDESTLNLCKEGISKINDLPKKTINEYNKNEVEFIKQKINISKIDYYFTNAISRSSKEYLMSEV